MPAPEDEVEIIEEVIEEDAKQPNFLIPVFILFSPLAICGLALFGSVLFCGNSVGGIFNGVQNVLASIGNIFSIDLFPNSTVVSSAPSIVERIKPLGQLVTTRVELANSRIEISTRYGIGNVCNIGALHSAQGAIEAGVSLEEFSPENIIYDEPTETYIIRLSQPTVTSCQLDPMQIIKYYEWGATVACPANWDEMRLLASYEAVNRFRDRAIEEDIIGRAEQQADLILSNFISSITGKAVRIEFIQPEISLGLPSSCEPEPPTGWRFDDTDQRWVKD
ncbi:MAG: DUF4230 domain-containing protein [bacterium]|nr:DUF4230 domain-containing protein [bacterium]